MTDETMERMEEIMNFVISIPYRMINRVITCIPYLLAKAYKALFKWKPPKELVALKRIPLLMLFTLQGGGYVLWIVHHYKLLLALNRQIPLGKHFYRGLHIALGHFLWGDPAVGDLGYFWTWFALFGPVCLGFTIWFLYDDHEFDPEKIGRFKISELDLHLMKANAQNRNDNFLGVSTTTREGIVLGEYTRESHAYCVGASRSGKTVSVMLPMAMRDIALGHPVIFFDGKGDVEHLNAMASQAEECGRAKDFMLFSLSDPARSRTYNPLSYGNATQKKDKLIGAFTWTEEHYKKVSEDTLLTVILALEGTGLYYNLEDLYLCLTETKALHRVHELCKSAAAKEHLENFFCSFAAVSKDITGLVKDIGLIVKNDFWPLLDTYCPEIDFFEAIQKKKIIYLVFNTQAYQDTAERLARLFLQDLRAVSDRIQNKVGRNSRIFTPIYVDEFNCFAFDAFGDFMSKCGGARFALTLAHQSLGQLTKRGASFKEEILDNANIKIIMRQDSPDTIDEFTRMIGTHTRTEYTQQTEDSLFFGKMQTGMGTAKQVETFNISPNRIRQLQPHQAVLLIKQPFCYDIVQLDASAKRDRDLSAIDRCLPSGTAGCPRATGSTCGLICGAQRARGEDFTGGRNPIRGWGLGEQAFHGRGRGVAVSGNLEVDGLQVRQPQGDSFHPVRAPGALRPAGRGQVGREAHGARLHSDPQGNGPARAGVPMDEFHAG